LNALIKHRFLVLTQVIVFYFLAIHIGKQAFQDHLVWPLINWLSDTFPTIKTFTQLDYGRLVGRVSGFIGVLVIYFIYIKVVNKLSITNSVFFPKSSKSKFFFYGVALGALMVTITIMITLLSKAIIMHPASNWIIHLVPTIILYLFAMLLTATTEELILRGYILKNLAEIINPHIAVIATSLVFGYMHFQVSFIYASLAFVFGLVVGYGFLWTRNIYFCIGVHFTWNFIESIVYSQSLFHITVLNPFLSGAKNITPDREGLLALPAVIIGLFVIFYIGKLWNLGNLSHK